MSMVMVTQNGKLASIAAMIRLGLVNEENGCGLNNGSYA